jgi:hypothetical protein
MFSNTYLITYESIPDASYVEAFNNKWSRDGSYVYPWYQIQCAPSIITNSAINQKIDCVG